MSAYHQSRQDDNDTTWMSDANPCKTSTVNFFPDNGGVELKAAVDVCLGCENRLPCLDYAIRNHIDHGVWGGQSERGRRRIAKARRNRAA